MSVAELQNKYIFFRRSDLRSFVHVGLKSSPIIPSLSDEFVKMQSKSLERNEAEGAAELQWCSKKFL